MEFWIGKVGRNCITDAFALNKKTAVFEYYGPKKLPVIATSI